MPFDDPAIFGVLVIGNSPPFDEVPPDAPQNLTATAGNTIVLLGWSDNTEADFDHYNIYQATVTGGPYTLIAVSTDSGYTVTGLTNGTTYFFVVTAVDDFGYESPFSNEASATPAVVGGGDVTAPAAPTWGSITPGDRQLSLNWNNNVEADLANYRVYRSTAQNGSYTLVATRTVSDWINTGLTNDTTYWYKLTAVDTTGNESIQSAALSGTPVSSGVPDTVAPAPPTGLTATASDRAVVLDWANNTEPDLSSYNVWQALSSNGSYTIVANVTASNRTVGALTNGTTYFFKVTALDTSGNESGFSNIASATPVAPDPGPGGGDDGFATFADASVIINVGEDWDTVINTVSAGTVIGVEQGVHTFNDAGDQFSPRNGEILVGEVDSNGVPLSIIRGNWDQTQGGGGLPWPFTFANSESYTSNVQFLRLDVQRFAPAFQQCALNGGPGWRYHKCYIHDNLSGGVRVGSNAIVFQCKIYRNMQIGIKQTTGCNNGVIDGCEVYDNNVNDWNAEGNEAGGMKFAGGLPTNMVVRRSHYHHNHGAGIWWDAGGAGGIIEDNLSEFNENPGIMYELTDGQGFIRRNISRFNSGAADIYIASSRGSSSNPIICEDNIVYNQTSGDLSHAEIWMKDDAARSVRLGYVTIRRNNIKRVIATQGGNQLAVGHFGETTLPPGITINENNYWTDISNAWQWRDVKQTWSAWRALGFDTAGTLAQASAFPYD